MRCPVCGREGEAPAVIASDPGLCFGCGGPAASPILLRRETVPREKTAHRSSLEERRAEARRLVEEQGMSLREAARAMGLKHASTVMRLVRAS